MADKIQMPSSGGGIVRYFDDYKSKIEFGPMVVLIMIIVVMVIVASYIVLNIGGFEGNKVTGSAESIPGQAGTYDPGTIGAARLTVPEKQSTLPGTDEKVRSFNVSVANSEIASQIVGGILKHQMSLREGKYV